MSLADRIVNRVRRSVRRRAKKALDVVEAWLLEAPRSHPEGAPLVSPTAAPEPEPILVDEEDEPTVDPVVVRNEVEEVAEELAEVHTLHAGLQYEQVEELLDDMVRPALQMDGGDITLVRVEPEGDVFVELKGACTTCPSATITMRNGIERLMADQLPGFRSLVEVHGVGDEDAAAGPG